MLYKNKKTGVVIDSPSVIVGERWELVEIKKTEPKKESRKTKE